MRTYSFFGLTIRSEIRLTAPEIPNSGDVSHDVTIQLGAVPDRLHDGRLFNSLNWAAPGRLLLRMPQVATSLIEDGTSITVALAPNVDDKSLALFIGASPIAGILHQRRRICLHASAVATPKGAVAFLGCSGFGKSTLAAALAARGYPLVTDDVAAIEHLDAPDLWAVHPGPGHLKLWPDSLAALGLDADSLPPVRPGMEKRFFSLPPAGSRPHRLAALCVLGMHRASEIQLTRLPLHRALEALMANTFRRRMQAAADSEQGNFIRLGRMLAALPCFIVHRPSVPFEISPLADRVEAMIAEL